MRVRVGKSLFIFLPSFLEVTATLPRLSFELWQLPHFHIVLDRGRARAESKLSARRHRLRHQKNNILPASRPVHFFRPVIGFLGHLFTLESLEDALVIGPEWPLVRRLRLLRLPHRLAHSRRFHWIYLQMQCVPTQRDIGL